MKNYFDLTGQVAIVTGCSTGLGVQMAKALANQGATIVALARRKEKIEEVLQEYTKRYNANPSYLTKIYPGLEELVRYLKKNDYQVAAYSNKPDNVLKPLMADIFEDGLFDYIEGQKEGVPAKPNPQVLNSIVDTFDMDKNQVVYVGDSDVDVETAKNAGVVSLAVSWGFRSREFLEDLSPDYLVDTAEEARDVIDKLRG